MRKKKVLVAMSGGVDSSAAAALLVQQGYDCDGAMLKLAPNEDSRCCSADDAEDARQAATRLGMRFYVFNETDRFRRCVMDRFTAEYAAGRTPNPCIDCNRELKFGALLDRALTLGYDYIATGHYARVAYDAESGRYRLLRGAERRKDQSYVLYQLTQHQLAHLLLPVGDYDKPAIRDKAREAGLDNADKGDSQDICFVPDGDYVTFLQRQGLTLTPGDFLDEAGRVLGRHRGLPCYTIGQGKGLGVAVGRHVYVLEKDRDRNAIVLGDDAALYASSLLASHVNWISGQIPAAPVRCAAKTRYSQVETPCTAYPLPDGGLRVVFDQPQRAITAGQAVVLYDGDEVLGGGTIEKANKNSPAHGAGEFFIRLDLSEMRLHELVELGHIHLVLIGVLEALDRFTVVLDDGAVLQQAHHQAHAAADIAPRGGLGTGKRQHRQHDQ